MYGQTCTVEGRGEVGPLRFGGASLCWGRSVTFHSHRSAGIPQVRWFHLARQYIALPRPWLPLRMESSVSRDLLSHVPQRSGLSGSSTLVYVLMPGLSGGDVVGGEEGVGAGDHPMGSWCVVVGCGEGVVQIVHEGHAHGGGWLLVVRGGGGPPGRGAGSCSGRPSGLPTFPAPTLWCRWGWRWVGGGPCQARGSGCGPGYPSAPARGVRLGVAPGRWVAPRFGPLWGAGSRRLGWREGGGPVGRCGGRHRSGSLGRLPPGSPPGPGWSLGCAGWCRRCGGAAPPGPGVPEGAAVPLRGCAGRRVQPVRRLVVRGVVGGVVRVGGGGRRCRVWGPVMGFLLADAGAGTRGGVCRRGHRHQSAGGGCRVSRLWPGLGGGGGGWCEGGTAGAGGGGGGCCAGWGSARSGWAVWVLLVRAVRSLRSLAGCGVQVWVGGGRMGVRVGLRSAGNGWLPVDGARWYGVWVGGLLVLVGCSY